MRREHGGDGAVGEDEERVEGYEAGAQEAEVDFCDCPEGALSG